MEIFRTFALVALVAFALHLAWAFFDIKAGVSGALYTLGAFALVSGFKGGLDWFREVRMRDYFMLITIGCLLSLFIGYKESLFSVSVAPLIQITLLLPLTVWISSRFLGRHGTLAA